MSEDFSFCMRAKAVGFQLHADTGLLCSHMIGPKFATKKTYDAYWAGRRRSKQERTLAALDGVA